MLSELQLFCIDAMGLSHGIKPPTADFTAPKNLAQQKTIHSVNNVPTAKVDSPSNNKKALEAFKNLAPSLSSANQKIIADNDTQIKPQSKEPKDLDNLDDWVQLQASIKSCDYCSDIAPTRTQPVFGQGAQQAQLMIIGEAPNPDEDIQGTPFIGRSGELLSNMLLAIDIKREDTFITNIIKCQPPNNRNPHVDEAAACQTFLNAQIKHIKPTLILALGRIAAHHLLGVKTPLGQLRGSVHQHQASQTSIIVSYHPDFLLRNLHQKQHTWEDLKLVHQYLQPH